MIKTSGIPEICDPPLKLCTKRQLICQKFCHTLSWSKATNSATESVQFCSWHAASTAVLNQHPADFSFPFVYFSYPLPSSGLQVNMSSPLPQTLQRLSCICSRKQRVEATPTPTHPAPFANMGQRAEGRNAVVDHDRHKVPDTLAGMSHLNSGMSIKMGEQKTTILWNYLLCVWGTSASIRFGFVTVPWKLDLFWTIWFSIICIIIRLIELKI